MASCGSTQNWAIVEGPADKRRWYYYGSPIRLEDDNQVIYRHLKVAIGVFDTQPTSMLTVSADISATGNVFTSGGSSLYWDAAWTTLKAILKHKRI